MRRPAVMSMVVSAVSLTTIGVVLAAPALSAGPCAGIRNDTRHQNCLDSVMPHTYSIHEMGMHDYGGGSRHFNGTKRNVAHLRGPDGPPDVSYRLKAARGLRPIVRVRGT